MRNKTKKWGEASGKQKKKKRNNHIKCKQTKPSIQMADCQIILNIKFSYVIFTGEIPKI